MRIPLSIIIITYNEEEHIAECLQSAGFADEIIIIDSFSKDRTVEIAKTFPNVIIHQHPWEGFQKQKMLALSLSKHEWILNMDGDEVLSLSLQNEIIDAVTRESDVQGFYLPEIPYFCSRFIRHSGWYPQYNFRLFKRGYVKMDKTLVHEAFEPTSNTDKFKGGFYHFTYSSLEEYMDKFNNYTSLDARERIVRGKRFKYYHLTLPFWQAFLRIYFGRLGFLDGLQGYLIALLTAFYEYVKFTKQRELLQNKG